MAVAERTELVHVHGGEPGVRRRRRGRGFEYIDPDGNPVADEDTPARIEALRIPPAWTDVWIATDPRLANPQKARRCKRLVTASLHNVPRSPMQT